MASAGLATTACASDGFLRAQRARDGDVFSVFLAGKRLTFITNPLDFTQVLVEPRLDFHGFAGRISSTLFGHSHESFEVAAAFADAERDADTGRPRVDAKVMKAVPHLDSAIDEALRLTSGSLTLREATEDLQLNLRDDRTVTIRQGDRVGIYPRLVHLAPELYEEPEAYRFDRYYRDGKRQVDFRIGEDRVLNHLMPFGGGRSICPGRHFAKNEIRLAVALLLHDVELDLAEGPPLLVDKTRAGLGILPPVGDVEVRLRRRA